MGSKFTIDLSSLLQQLFQPSPTQQTTAQQGSKFTIDLGEILQQQSQSTTTQTAQQKEVIYLPELEVDSQLADIIPTVVKIIRYYVDNNLPFMPNCQKLRIKYDPTYMVPEYSYAGGFSVLHPNVCDSYIVFKTVPNDRLLAHELAHLVLSSFQSFGIALRSEWWLNEAIAEALASKATGRTSSFCTSYAYDRVRGKNPATVPNEDVYYYCYPVLKAIDEALTKGLSLGEAVCRLISFRPLFANAESQITEAINTPNDSCKNLADRLKNVVWVWRKEASVVTPIAPSPTQQVESTPTRTKYTIDLSYLLWQLQQPVPSPTATYQPIVTQKVTPYQQGNVCYDTITTKEECQGTIVFETPSGLVCCKLARDVVVKREEALNLARDVVVKREEALNQLVTTIINVIPLFLLIEIIKLLK